MIYEMAYVVKPDAPEEMVNGAKNLIVETIKEFQGEVLIQDGWGVKTLAQPFENGLRKGNFLYVMYKAPGTVNAELDRKLNINDAVARFIIVKLGNESQEAEIVKGYRNPNTTQVVNNETGELLEETDKEKKMHSKRRSCYFSSKKAGPDWKDPKSYSWLVNEFGKISPLRVTGLTPKYQRKACDAIKRGRVLGLLSYVSNEIAR